MEHSPAFIADSQYRNEHISASSPKSEIESDAPILLPLHLQYPSLKIFTPSSPSFPALASVFHHTTTHPLAIVRPTTSLEISTIIKFCIISFPSIPFRIRVGGHDSWGRSTIGHDGIVIDLREMDSISLSPNKASVKIGGGAITYNLTRFLEPHNLVAVQGNYHSVGYTGWATLGGFGPLNGSFGLGCDQILAAEIVTPAGEIVQADEETLWGLRGGGCNFGVVTELTIQVHKLEKVLAGMIVFKLEDAREVLMGHKKLLETGLPEPTSGDFSFFSVPGPLGVVLAMFFCWGAGDLEEGKSFLEKVRGLGNAAMDTVVETTMAKNMEASKAVSFYDAYLNMKTTTVPTLSTEFIDVLLKSATRIPLGSRGMILVHPVHGEALKPSIGSCFGTRNPRLNVEVIGATLDEGNKDETFAWADEIAGDLKRIGASGGHPAHFKNDEMVAVCYGKNWERLQSLKRKLDGENVLRAVPSLSSA